MRFGRDKIAFVVVSCALSLAMLRGPQQSSDPDAAHAAKWQMLSLIDSEGKLHTSAEWAGKKAVVLLFVTTDCPLSNAYVPELNRMERDYAPRGIVFYAIQGDATIPVEEVRRHVKEFGYGFPYLLDSRELLATYTGATTTPESAVISPTGKLLYLGRIDNRVEDYGKRRVQVTEFDLRDALDAIVSGKAVPHPRTKAFGCAIIRGRDITTP